MSKLTKEECLKALSFIEDQTTEIEDYRSIPWVSVNEFEKEITILRKLINEHFDNKSLKFEDLEDVTGAWDNKFEKWCLIIKDSSAIFKNGKPHEQGILVKYSNFTTKIIFEDDRFYRKKIEEK